VSKLRVISASLGAACLATAGVTQFAAHWPTVALVTLIAGTFFGALAVNLPGKPADK